MLQPIAEKVVCDIHSAIGNDVELIDVFNRSLAYTSSFLHSQTSSWLQRGRRLSDGIIICESPYDYSVMLQSINLQGENICYIAVGGKDKNELIISARMVRWLANMLISQYLNNPSLYSIKSLRKLYFENLLFSNQTQKELRIQAKTAEVNPDGCFCVVVLRLWSDEWFDVNPTLHKNAWNLLSKELESYSEENFFATHLDTMEKQILISEKLEASDLKLDLTKIADNLEKRFDKQFRVYAGISMPSSESCILRLCYDNACTICEKLSSEKNTILLQSECLINLLMERIPLETKIEFISQIFRDYPQEDIDEWSRIVEVLDRNNGSISKSADELFMHKNTIQYRLARIKEKIGLDARDSQDALSLRLAFMARQSIINSKNGSGKLNDIPKNTHTSSGFFPIFTQL